jgi:redox-sensitive bicupin YhaK (pirin superfamily)
MTDKKFRSVLRVFTAPEAADGDGVPLRRAFPSSFILDLDPFLLLDEMGPMDPAPGAARGFPPHPHRGFETVTYLLSGEMQHRDSWGNHGILRPGDVQWMTAGSGLVHSEMPSERFIREGGRLHGFQLWVNLPKRDKMIPPHYQDAPAERIPLAAAPGVIVKVIAGESLKVRGVAEPRTPILYLHVTLEPGAPFVQDLPKTQNAFLFVIDGEAQVAGTQAFQKQIVILDRSADAVQVTNPGHATLSFLLIAGEPIGEPVARYGPFVMNTKEELAQAVEDFRQGRMGRL